MKYIYLFLLLFSLQSHAETGIECLTPSSRCSAYNLDVNVDVLQAIVFEQYMPLSLGQVTKGEIIDLNPQTFLGSLRGRSLGMFSVRNSINTDGVTIKCLPESSGVYFKDGELTKFTYCDMRLTGVSVWDQNIHMSGDDIFLDEYEGLTFSTINIGGTITVPSDATSGNKSGLMRIEVTYE